MKKRIIALLMCGVICMQAPIGDLSAETVSENSVETIVSGNDVLPGETEEMPEAADGDAPEDVSVSDNEFGGWVMGYHDIDVEPPAVAVPDPSADEYSAQYAVTLPAKYRSDEVDTDGDGTADTNYLPALRNQNPYGTCWAFSAVGACEASLIKQGLADTSINLSPLHLAYYFYKKGGNVGDLLGNMAGDYNRSRSGDYLNVGGNSYMTMWHLANWAGPAAESAFPYSKAGSSLSLANNTQSVFGNSAFHVQNVYIINTEDKASMKQMIMQHGGLGISYYATDTSDGEEYDSMAAGMDTGDEGSYYCYDMETTNHAVMVVGWDDSYSASNFVEKAPGNGAWLIRNSWGEEDNRLSQSGYFWISYYDTSLSEAAFVYDCELPDNYDNIYQHDGASGAAWVKSYAAANVFTAANRGGVDEELKAVSIGVDIGEGDGNVAYTVDVYTYEGNPVVNASNVTSGLKASSQSGVFEYAGYHTVELNTPVLLSAGQRYAVVFTFTNKPAKVNYDVSTSYGWIYFKSNQKQGQSFVRQNNLGMKDCALWGSDSGNVRIKAFTDASSGSLTGISLNKSSLNLNDGDKTQVTASISGGSRNTRIKWTSSNPSVASVVNGNIVAKGYGSAVVTATTMNGKSASCTVNVVTTDVMKPLIESAKPSAYNKICIKWVKSHNAAGYVVYRSDKKNGKYKAVKTVKKAGTTSYTDKKVTCGNTYYYKVKYFCYKGGKKVYSGFSQAIKVKAAPTAPTITKAAGGSKKASLKWKKVSGANGYVIYRSASASSKGKAVATVSKKNTYTDKKLKKGKTYYYTIKSYRTVKGKKVYSDYSERVAVYVK